MLLMVDTLHRLNAPFPRLNNDIKCWSSEARFRNVLLPARLCKLPDYYTEGLQGGCHHVRTGAGCCLPE